MQSIYNVNYTGMNYKTAGKLPAAASTIVLFNPTALKKAKIVYNFGLCECSGVNMKYIPPFYSMFQ